MIRTLFFGLWTPKTEEKEEAAPSCTWSARGVSASTREGVSGREVEPPAGAGEAANATDLLGASLLPLSFFRFFVTCSSSNRKIKSFTS